MSNLLIKQVLVVDDEVSYLLLCEKGLSRIGINCKTATSADSAIEMLRRHEFDLVLSDIRMGSKDGIKLMKEVKSFSPHLDFIIMTGHAAEYSYSDIIEAGATDYLLKPFEIQELKAKLERIDRERRVLHRFQEANSALRHSVDSLRKILEGTIQAIALTIEIRDPYTAGHQKRVATLARLIAREIGLKEEQTEGIYMAGVVHDLGKISVPAEILSKSGKLGCHEMALIKSHPQVGFEILENIDFPWPIADLVLQHHERIDGSGYPFGLSGDSILLESRILTVADVVEAMVSHRPYRPALGKSIAIEEIARNKGKYYDPDVVDACMRLISRGTIDWLFVY